MVRSKWKAAALAAAVIVAGLAWAGDVPRPAPPLSVAVPGGQHISLESLRGKVVLLEFFLTECSHCQRTAGTIGPVYKEWRARGLEVLAVAINPDAQQQIPEFRQRFGATYPIGLGTKDLVKEFAGISAVRNFFVPYLFLIDRKGVIRYEHEGTDSGFFDNEGVNLRVELDALLRETAPVRKAASKSPPKS